MATAAPLIAEQAQSRSASAGLSLPAVQSGASTFDSARASEAPSSPSKPTEQRPPVLEEDAPARADAAAAAPPKGCWASRAPKQRKLLVILAALLLIGGVVGGVLGAMLGKPKHGLPGPYDVAMANFTTTYHFACTGHEVFVIYPKTWSRSRKFPVIVHHHGVSGLTGENFQEVLSRVASFGFILLAPNSNPHHKKGVCNSKKAWRDAIMTMDHVNAVGEVLEQGIGYDAADWERVGIWGRSMGGKTVSRAVDDGTWDFKAAVLQNGARHSEWINIPSLYLTATKDGSSSPPKKMQQEYGLNEADSKVLLNVDGEHHILSAKKEAVVDSWIAKFFLCHVAESDADCDEVYDQGFDTLRGEDSLCSNGFFKQCLIKGHPHHPQAGSSSGTEVSV